MDPFTILAIVLGIVGTISSVMTNEANVENANEQLNNQQNFSHNEAELANQRALENYWATQSPKSRVQQLKDAGLSVGLMYGGNAAGGGVNAGTQASTPGANLPVMQNPINGGIQDIFENIKKMKESENIGEDTEKKKQEVENLKSQIEVNNATITKIATENNLTEVLTANTKLDGIMKEIENEVAEATKKDRIKIVNTQLENIKKEGDKLLEEINGLQIDNENKQKMYDATVQKIYSEIALTYKQVIKTEAETALTKATTALTTEQTNLTFAQRQKTWKEIEKTKKELAEIDATIKMLETNTEKVKWDKATEILRMIQGTAQAASMFIK